MSDNLQTESKPAPIDRKNELHGTDGNAGSSIVIKGVECGDNFLSTLPSVEEMQRAVANATCELQQTFFLPDSKSISSGGEHSDLPNSTDGVLVDPKVSIIDEAFENLEHTAEDPLQRTREEMVSEELIINGKRYRHTYQKRIVLERQKTREVFILPASPKSGRISDGNREDRSVSSDFENNNDAFDEKDVRLDLSVRNLEGGFRHRVVVVPQRSSPGSPSRSDSLKPGSSVKVLPETTIADDEGHAGHTLNLANLVAAESGHGNTPLVVSHMYHFGRWDKGAAILDPRLPAGLNLQGGHLGLENSIFCVSPAEWHQSDISYSGGASNGGGTTAKGRIVACLQRFTQRSAQTGKELYRSTYVQHTKIARWRISSRPHEDSEPKQSVTNNQNENIQISASQESSDNTSDCVANISDVWKRGARSPLSGDGEAVDFPNVHTALLQPCAYDRLQLLQLVCPAAAAAVMILGGQMPEMRATEGQPASRNPSSVHCAVSAHAWCPRALMYRQPPEGSLIFSSPPSSADKESSRIEQQDCILRGGTLDALLVYALQIFKQNKSHTYEYLIPEIFIRLYPTFTIPNEVVSRLIQRFLAFAPIEPGGLGCLGDEEEGKEDSEDAWSEALNTLRFLLKLIALSEITSADSQLCLKVVSFAQLLKLDAKVLIKPSAVPPLDCESASASVESSPVKSVKESAISNELYEISESLLDLVPKPYGGLLHEEASANPTDEVVRPESASTMHTCTCYDRLQRFQRLDTVDMAEQITLMEEVFFDQIRLDELIHIKNLERGNTPTLFHCVQHFNSLNTMVKCLTLIAREVDQPLPKVAVKLQCDSAVCTEAPTGGSSDSPFLCHLCNLQRNASWQTTGFQTNGRLEMSTKQQAIERRDSLKSYLCMSYSTSTYLSLRTKRNNVILNATLWKLCALAEELKKMNNFSSFLAVILGLQNAQTLNVSKKVKQKLNDFGAYMLPPSFSAYRRDLEAAKMPCLPYLGLVFQQLIHLDSGNLLFLPSTPQGKNAGGVRTKTEEEKNSTRVKAGGDSGLITGDEADANKVVNFWRCWKHYLILGYFMKRADCLKVEEEGERRSYDFEPKPEVQEFLNSFNVYSASLHQAKIDSCGRTPRSQRIKSVNLPTTA